MDQSGADAGAGAESANPKKPKREREKALYPAVAHWLTEVKGCTDPVLLDSGHGSFLSIDVAGRTPSRAPHRPLVHGVELKGDAGRILTGGSGYGSIGQALMLRTICAYAYVAWPLVVGDDEGVVPRGFHKNDWELLKSLGYPRAAATTPAVKIPTSDYEDAIAWVFRKLFGDLGLGLILIRLNRGVWLKGGLKRKPNEYEYYLGEGNAPAFLNVRVENRSTRREFGKRADQSLAEVLVHVREKIPAAPSARLDDAAQVARFGDDWPELLTPATEARAK